MFSVSLLGACIDDKYEKKYYNTNTQMTPEMRTKLSFFYKQEHRIEFNGCELIYNDITFKIGDDSSEIKGELGSPSTEVRSNNNRVYYWISDAIGIRENLESNTINLFLIDFKSDYFKGNEFYVLVEGIPLDKEMTMRQFVDSSHYEFDQFEFGNYSYEKTFQNCERPLVYSFYSNVRFNYIGEGHARLKGEPDLSDTSTIESLEVSYF